ncbi:hypothetical protein QQS21_003003 [Conoideocrella luteorostrata]|uniref:ABC transporter n=1 Tax=Conoideocrella luteorostrata TaxID=1105319 RepID=A0AAJ0G2J6_9HYPO|nr:hypothetical protein QQS21_003003 [Conoideocrella luteorostrata]
MVMMPQIWLKLRTQSGTGPKDYGYLGGYIGFALTSTVFGALTIGFYVLAGVPKSAIRLHEMLLNSVVRAPFYFFTSTNSGITLNRSAGTFIIHHLPGAQLNPTAFSQDMKLIDNALLIAFDNATMRMSSFTPPLKILPQNQAALTNPPVFLRALAETGLLASGASYVAAFIPVCFVALYFVQKCYLRTSRQMRFLDLEMKSPLYTQFTKTLSGLSTIRAFGWSLAFVEDNHRRLDTSQKPFYNMFAIQRWLQVVLDLFVAGMALVLVSVALNIPNHTTKGAIGLALVNLIGFNQTLTMVIDQWTRLETSLGAVARLKWFMNNTPDENKEYEKEIPQGEWPSIGNIELDNVVASYSDDTTPVLLRVSLKVKGGQKVGICGRSGSGKSSLILTLSRALDIQSGSISIDSHNLAHLTRQLIRSRLTALSQDAIKLSGTVRRNLDPESHIQADQAFEDALRKTTMRETISHRGGLDADMDELGLSAGQLQLFCLARVLLSHGAVVLLDEATRSIDLRTDEEVRRVIKEEMRERTVMEVAHRLEVVRECDMVVVMAEGMVMEVGEPEELLERDSAFREGAVGKSRAVNHLEKSW